MNNHRVASKVNLIAGLLAGIACLWSVTAYSASDCAIGLKIGSAPTLNGIEDSGEWVDASVLDSASSPCLANLMDYDKATDTYPPRNITVKSKRYQRGATWYLGFLFTVHDATSEGPCSGGLCIGEKIIMHFNRVINGDTRLTAGQDARFTLTHKWRSPDPLSLPSWCTVDTTNCVVSEVGSTSDSSLQSPLGDPTCHVDPTDGTTPLDPGYVKWGTRTTFTGINAAVRKGLTGGGYVAEIEVPLSFVNGTGNALTTDIGVAFDVVNDFGKNSFGGAPDFNNCAPGGTCEGAGAGFPLSLPNTNDANPVDATCDKGWVVPKQWGVGYITNPPGQVTISRLPTYYTSNGINVFECSSTTSSYTYYPANPCKIRIQAILNNTGSATRRKVVFLWAKHGTGDPTEYNFVDLKEAVVSTGTPATPGSTVVESGLWAGMPKNEANHPCLRAYIFPDGLSTADENTLRGASTGGVVSKASLDAVVAANGVEDQHWAQKNISRHNTITQCPDASCRVAALSPIRLDPIATAVAADTPRVAAGGVTVVGATGQVSTRASTILLPGADWERYAKDHVIVNVRTVAYRIPAGAHNPRYSFVEEFSGVVQMFPLAMVNANRDLPFELQVSNGSRWTMRVKVLTETHVPAGVAGVKVAMAQKELTLQPRSVTTLRGTVANPSAPEPCEGLPSFCCKATKRDGLALASGVLLVGLVGFGVRRRRKR